MNFALSKSQFLLPIFAKVVKTFKKLADANLLAFGTNVTTCMATAVTVFPNPMQALAEIITELDNFAGLIQTAASRDKVQVQVKKQSRFNLLLMLSQLGLSLYLF